MHGLLSAFASVSVADIQRARGFYEGTLGLDVVVEMGPGLIFDCGGRTFCFVYEKGEHVPAQHTVLNFMVEDVEKTVDGLADRGVSMTPPEGMETDAKGISVGGPAPIAWFNDPDGNWLAVAQAIEPLR